MAQKCVCLQAIDRMFANGHRPDVHRMLREERGFRVVCRYCGLDLRAAVVHNGAHVTSGLAPVVRCWPWWRRWLWEWTYRSAA